MTGTSILFFLFVVVILILIAAICSGSEVAVLATSRVRLYHLSKKGNHRAGVILELQERIGNFISAVLLLNTWIVILISSLVTAIMNHVFGTTMGTVYASIITFPLITIYAELAPKLFVYTNPDRVALALAPLFKPMMMILSPLTRALDAIAKGSLRLVGINLSAEIKPSTTTEELRGAIELHNTPGGNADYERSMLRSILDLATIQVTEIMRHRKNMFFLDASLPAAQIVEKILKSPFTRIPLWRNSPDNIIGILHVRDLMKVIQNPTTEVNNIDIDKLITPAWFIPETTTLFSQLQAFRERHEHFALVVDEYGALQGMVTLEDILEEIVGEIVDEHDVELPGVRLSPDGTYIVDGIVTLRDLNRQFGWELPDEHAATIAGLILYETRQIPDVGQSFMVHGFRMDILRRQRHQVTQVRITPPAS